MSTTPNATPSTILITDEYAKIRDAVFEDAAERLGYTRSEMDEIALAMEMLDTLNSMVLVAICQRAMGDGPLARQTYRRWTHLVGDEIASVLSEREFEVGKIINRA